jgi:PPOX class probable F420-dependent enzyme
VTVVPTFAEVAKAEYILLTTFTKDGRPKPTPIGAAPSGDGLVVITQEKSWKVKRIRNTSRVTIAECDRSGKNAGEAVEARATILDKSANGPTYAAISSRYGLIGKGFTFFSKLNGGMKKNVTIRLEAAA